MVTCQEFGTDAIVEMELDLNQKTLSFTLNGDQQLYVFSEVYTAKDTVYSMCVCVNWLNDCVTLLKYEQY